MEHVGETQKRGWLGAVPRPIHVFAKKRRKRIRRRTETDVDLSPFDHVGQLLGISLSELQRDPKGALNKGHLRELAFCASHMSKIGIL
jgi:hypothetical protein